MLLCIAVSSSRTKSFSPVPLGKPFIVDYNRSSIIRVYASMMNRTAVLLLLVALCGTAVVVNIVLCIIYEVLIYILQPVSLEKLQTV